MLVEWLEIPTQSEIFVRQGHCVSLGVLVQRIQQAHLEPKTAPSNSFSDTR